MITTRKLEYSTASLDPYENRLASGASAGTVWVAFILVDLKMLTFSLINLNALLLHFLLTSVNLLVLDNARFLTYCDSHQDKSVVITRKVHGLKLKV